MVQKKCACAWNTPVYNNYKIASQCQSKSVQVHFQHMAPNQPLPSHVQNLFFMTGDRIKMRGDEMYRYTGHVLVVAILIRHYHFWNTSHCVSHSMDNIIKLI